MPKTYKHLDANERDILAVLKSKGRSLREISTILKRSSSTLSRELERNAPPVYTGYYLSHKAQERADKRNRESHRRPRLKTDSLRQYVEKRIRLGWSPELIAGRLAIEHPELSISHEAIYQWIYQEATHLILSLVRAHRKRKHRGYSRKHKKSHIPQRISITYDNGSENAEHLRTNKILGTCSYFCEPFHSYERGTVENTIGLVRRFLPKKTNLAKISQDHLVKIEYWLNNRPRKCLGFKTPAEVFKAECCT